MEDVQSVPELIAAAQISAKALAEPLSDSADQERSDAQRAAVRAIELAAIDIFSVFEARMQHHFRRGPFARKLKALLLECKRDDLAKRFHRYYLAINVLKHGKGSSHRELLKAPAEFRVLTSNDGPVDDETQRPAALVDVTVPGFFDALCDTLLEAHQFLEKRSGT
ncbi:hypothetical protein NBRC116601_21050 [Cognatishimia sp. WU-CL00825]|uniref:hypothetical protein n=1 Tax=Cognatishimia sp. WU-CL00825 TaxID=3127658 RepID=UPI0031042C68